MLEQNNIEAGVIAKGGSKVPNTTLESWLTANRAEIIERPLDLATSTALWKRATLESQSCLQITPGAGDNPTFSSD